MRRIVPPQSQSIAMAPQRVAPREAEPATEPEPEREKERVCGVGIAVHRGDWTQPDTRPVQCTFPSHRSNPKQSNRFFDYMLCCGGGTKKLLKYSVQYSTLCAKGSKANTGSVANCYQSCFSVSTKLLLILIKVRVLKKRASGQATV